MLEYIPSYFALPLLVIGTAGAFVITWTINEHIYTYYVLTCTIHRFLRNGSNNQSREQDSKAWALVTGGSDGIGFQVVNQLAERGFNVVLHVSLKLSKNQHMFSSYLVSISG